MELFSIGLIVIAIGWIIQAYFLFKGKKEIRTCFIVLYILGVAVLLFADYQATQKVSYFELITLIAALLSLIKLIGMK
ncbi:MAG: hypothetical protein AABX11_00340 [Nanoarchaeota archaeon]